MHYKLKQSSFWSTYLLLLTPLCPQHTFWRWLFARMANARLLQRWQLRNSLSSRSRQNGIFRNWSLWGTGREIGTANECLVTFSCKVLLFRESSTPRCDIITTHFMSSLHLSSHMKTLMCFLELPKTIPILQLKILPLEMSTHAKGLSPPCSTP